MRVSTTVMLLGAAACAAGAAIVTKIWLGGRPSQPAAIEQVAAPANKTIVVAAVPLKFGMVLSADALSEVSWPSGFLPPDAFTSKAALIGGGQRIVRAAIAKNEPILASKITAPGQSAALSVMISPGRKAVTIRVDDVLGVAGFVQPDDRVDVLLTRGDRSIASAKPGLPTAFTDLLLQNVRVLAIDQFAERNTQAKPVKAVTLEVETDDAQKLVLAASVGQLSLTLRGAGWTQTSAPRRIGLDDLPASRAPETLQAGPVERQPDREPLVTVIRGAGERKQYSIGSDMQRAAVGVPSSSEESLKSAEAPRAAQEAEPQVQPR